jgi:hypothetical protein
VQENYENQVKEGKKGGRKPNPNTDAIKQMALEGKKCKEIAEVLGMNEKTVYGNSGWKEAQEQLKNPLKNETISQNSTFSF